MPDFCVTIHTLLIVWIKTIKINYIDFCFRISTSFFSTLCERWNNKKVLFPLLHKYYDSFPHMSNGHLASFIHTVCLVWWNLCQQINKLYLPDWVSIQCWSLTTCTETLWALLNQPSSSAESVGSVHRRSGSRMFLSVTKSTPFCLFSSLFAAMHSKQWKPTRCW